MTPSLTSINLFRYSEQIIHNKIVRIAEQIVKGSHVQIPMVYLEREI